MNETRIEELEARVTELTALVERLTLASAAPAVDAPVAVPLAVPEAVREPELVSSRRGVLRLAGAAAAGAVAVAVVGNASPAAATTGQPMLIGAPNSPTAITDVTSLNGNMQVNGNFVGQNDSGASATSSGVNGVITAVNTSTTTDTLLRGGVTGVGAGANGTSHGVLGSILLSGKGSAVTGTSDSTVVGVSAGVRARSANGPSIQMVPVVTGPPTSGSWSVGAFQPDTTGRLFYCTVSGTPGTWIELTAAPAAVVQLHAIDPARVFDSRSAAPSMGQLTSGNNKAVSVKDSRNASTGAVVLADIVPAGAVAIVGNLTVTNTVNSGFLSVTPGDASTSIASTINWFGSNQNLANGFTVKIDANRQVKVFAGGGGATDFIVDITGFYI